MAAASRSTPRSVSPAATDAGEPPVWDIETGEPMAPHDGPTESDPLAQREPDYIFDQRSTWSDPGCGVHGTGLPRVPNRARACERDSHGLK